MIYINANRPPEGFESSEAMAGIMPTRLIGTLNPFSGWDEAPIIKGLAIAGALFVALKIYNTTKKKKFIKI